MSWLFYECKQLKLLPDLSKWKTDNNTDMSYMFTSCNSLISLPEISKWNTSNVTDMNSLFYQCNSLKSIPNISDWDISKVNDISYMFAGFILSELLLNKSEDNNSYIDYLEGNLTNSLQSLPDLSRWNTSNVIDMSFMFAGNNSLISLPDISNWNI